MPALIDITGHRFNRWTVLGRGENRQTQGHRFSLTYWTCKCTCGVIKDIRAASLIRGKSKSCGCLRAENYRAMVTHGMTYTAPEYSVWQNMLNRCRNRNIPGYQNYGGRGITVSDRWLKFENFIADMGPRPSPQHSIDRRDVNLGYFPDNCRWATAQEQVTNRRKIACIEQFTDAELLAEMRRRAASIWSASQ